MRPARDPPESSTGEEEGPERNGDRANSSSPDELKSCPLVAGTGHTQVPGVADPAVVVDFEHTVTPKMAIQQYIDKVSLLGEKAFGEGGGGNPCSRGSGIVEEKVG